MAHLQALRDPLVRQRRVSAQPPSHPQLLPRPFGQPLQTLLGQSQTLNRRPNPPLAIRFAQGPDRFAAHRIGRAALQPCPDPAQQFPFEGRAAQRPSPTHALPLRLQRGPGFPLATLPSPSFHPGLIERQRAIPPWALPQNGQRCDCSQACTIPSCSRGQCARAGPEGQSRLSRFLVGSIIARSNFRDTRVRCAFSAPLHD